MLQVINHTPFSAALSVFADPQGVETAYAVVKASFAIAPEGPVVLLPPVPLLPGDVYWGDASSTSLRAAGEFALLKTATDVLLTGHAVAPSSNTRIADVSLQVGPVSRSIRVFGDRRWERSGGRWRPSAPQTWERMPLRWERAWGGIALLAEGDKGPPEHDPRNPVGCGMVGRNGTPTDDQPLPNLEDPQALLNDPADRPTPACFAPIAPVWQPRRGFAGTYDEAWTRGRAPYLPKDFDPRFFQIAPPALIAPGFLQGGEPVVLSGFNDGAPIHFSLPDCGLDLEFDFDGAPVPGEPQLETVLFEPDLRRFQMLWRAALAVDKKLLRLRHLTVRSTVYGRDGNPPISAADLDDLDDIPVADTAEE